MKITDILAKKKFTVSFELIPPRNNEGLEQIFEKVKILKDLGADFISVTKGAGGSLRGGTLPLTYFIKEKYGIESIAHFTCIDSTTRQIENSLVEHFQFGIENLLALRGDLPDIAPDVKRKTPAESKSYTYAWQLVKKITELNSGLYFPRKGFEKGQEHIEGVKTDFCIGVAAHPEEKDLEKAVQYLKKKVGEGAHYAITQMFFSPALYGEFISATEKNNISIPIIPGVKAITSYDEAVKLGNNFNIPVAKEIKDALKGLSKEEQYKKGVEFAAEFCKDLKESGAPGIHLFIMNNIKVAKDVLKNFKH